MTSDGEVIPKATRIGNLVSEKVELFPHQQTKERQKRTEISSEGNSSDSSIRSYFSTGARNKAYV